MATADYFARLSDRVKTVAINTNTSGDNTIHTVTAGTRFCVYQLWLQAEAGVDVTIKSGANALTAPITFAANAEKEWLNSGVGVFLGRAVGENFIVNLSGAMQVNGFAVVTELQGTTPL